MHPIWGQTAHWYYKIRRVRSHVDAFQQRGAPLAPVIWAAATFAITPLFTFAPLVQHALRFAGSASMLTSWWTRRMTTRSSQGGSTIGSADENRVDRIVSLDLQDVDRASIAETCASIRDASVPPSPLQARPRIGIVLRTHQIVRDGPEVALRVLRHIRDCVDFDAVIWDLSSGMEQPGVEDAIRALLFGTQSLAFGLQQGIVLTVPLPEVFPWAAAFGGHDAYGSYDRGADFILARVVDSRRTLQGTQSASIWAEAIRLWNVLEAHGAVHWVPWYVIDG